MMTKSYASAYPFKAIGVNVCMRKTIFQVNAKLFYSEECFVLTCFVQTTAQQPTSVFNKLRSQRNDKFLLKKITKLCQIS